jgi:hypothetical protein
MNDNVLESLPESLRYLLKWTLQSRKPWHEDAYGRIAHEAFLNSIRVNENHVELYEGIIRDFDSADESQMLPEFSERRVEHRRDLETSLDRARRALEAVRMGLTIVKNTAS